MDLALSEEAVLANVIALATTSELQIIVAETRTDIGRRLCPPGWCKRMKRLNMGNDSASD